MTNSFHTSSFVLGIALGAALASAWFLGASIPLPPQGSPPVATTTPAARFPESGAVSVSDQPAGRTVLIQSVTVPPPGVWIAVRDTDSSSGQAGGDGLGNVLGALRVHGPLSNVSVPLLRPTEPGRVYAVELYRDDGDGNFDPTNDSVYVDFDTGVRVVALFTTQ